MADTDLTSTILKYTDRHLGLPLLQHLGSLNIFKQDDIAKAMYELAKGTSMVDFAMQLHADAYPDEPAPTELKKQREEAEAQNERLAGEVENVLNVIEDPTVADSLKQDKAQNLQWLEEHYKVCMRLVVPDEGYANISPPCFCSSPWIK
jgi:translation initiation factor 3 subunit E